MKLLHSLKIYVDVCPRYKQSHINLVEGSGCGVKESRGVIGNQSAGAQHDRSEMPVILLADA